MIYFVGITLFTVVFQNEIVDVLSQTAPNAEKLLPGYVDYDAMQKKAEEILFNPVLEKLDKSFSHFTSNATDSIKSRREMDAQTDDFLRMLELESGSLDFPGQSSKRTKRHVNKIINHLNKIDEEQSIRYKRRILEVDAEPKLPKTESNKFVETHVKTNDIYEIEDDFFKDMPKAKKPVNFKSNMLMQMLLAGNKIKTGVRRKMGGVKEIATGSSNIGEGVFGFLKAGTSAGGALLG